MISSEPGRIGSIGTRHHCPPGSTARRLQRTPAGPNSEHPGRLLRYGARSSHRRSRISTRGDTEAPGHAETVGQHPEPGAPGGSGQLLHDDRILNRGVPVAFVTGTSAAFITGAVLTIDDGFND
jgi:hypothetical protein